RGSGARQVSFGARADLMTRGAGREAGLEPNEKRGFDADDTAADPETPEPEGLSREIAPHGGMPPEAWRVHPRLHHDAEEAELGASEGGQDPPDQRLRGHRLHPG